MAERVKFSSVLGVVLSGGQSTRMNQDKGLMKVDGRTWAENAYEKLSSLSIPAVVAINQQQLLEYSQHFRGKDLVIDNPELKVLGPLAGLISVHLIYPEQDILILACDMIKIESAVIEELLSEYQRKQPEAIAFRGDNVEPLCAIYSARGLKKIISHYYTGALEKHSMMNVLEALHAKYLPIKEEWKSLFKNFNQVGDLEQ